MNEFIEYVTSSWVAISISLVVGFLSSFLAQHTELLPLIKNRRAKQLQGVWYSCWSSVSLEKPEFDKFTIKKKRGLYIFDLSSDDKEYLWSAHFRLVEHRLIGSWVFEDKDGYESSGSAYIRLTGYSTHIGLWVGDAEAHSISYGYWIISKDQNELMNVNQFLQEQLRFKSYDIFQALDYRNI